MDVVCPEPRSSKFERILQPRWLLIIAVFWLAVLIGPRFLPASWWVEFGELQVSDTEIGKSPEVTFTYHVNRRVAAEIVFRLEYESSPGAFAYYCRASVVRVFQPDEAPTQVKTDLAWLTGVPFGGTNCVPRHPGHYRVRVEMTLHPEIAPSRTAGIVSNPFRADDRL